MPAAVSWRRSRSIVMPSGFGAPGQITMPSRQNPTLVMVPSEILPVSSTSRPSSNPAARAASQNRPAPVPAQGDLAGQFTRNVPLPRRRRELPRLFRRHSPVRLAAR
jgi:hypothetical protein